MLSTAARHNSRVPASPQTSSPAKADRRLHEALAEAMALIAGARGMASNDSGLMHVAAAFGIPQAAMFGSTSPEHTPPLNPRARVLWLKDELALDCAPCFDRACRFGHTRCLTGIAPARALAALQEALAAG